jgi:putative ABC transport system permease protein
MKRGGTPSFRWLLRLLPLDVREAHGADLERTLRDVYADTPSRSISRIRFWTSTLADIVRVAPGQHAESIMSDVRFAVRYFCRAPAFAVAAVLTLALGIGATTTVFAFVNAVLLRPLPYRDPGRVVLVWSLTPQGTRTWLSVPELEDLQRRVPALSSLAGLTDMRFALTGSGAPEELSVVGASASLFGALGVEPQAGRLFDPTDDVEHAPLVAILSDGLWRRRFGGDSSVLGKVILLDGRRYSVVGVAPPSFSVLPPSAVFPARVDVWVPLQTHLPVRGRDVRYLHALGRLRDGAALADARAQLIAAGVELSAVFPEYRGAKWSFDAVPMQEDVVRGVQPALLVLFAIGGLVLFIACANVAALLLSRATSRHREMAVRTAVGASRGRIGRQLLTEGLVLSAIGGVAGLAIAAWAPLLARMPSLAALPRFDQVAVDWRVTVFAAVASVITALVFAMAPLAELSRHERAGMQDTLRTASIGRRAMRAGRVLAVAQIAIAAAVLVVSLVLARGFAGLLSADPGFSTERLLTMRIALPPKYQAPADVARYFDQAIGNVRQVPGVTNVAAVTQLPLSGSMLGSTFTIEDRPDARQDADLRGVTPGYFETLGIPIIEGRGFSPADDQRGVSVAIVDQVFAKRVWPNESGIGKRIRWFRQPDRVLEVIGVAGAVRHRGMDVLPRETVYRPHAQYARWTMFVAVGGAAPTNAARRTQPGIDANPRIDPDQPVAEVSTMRDRASRSLASPGFGAAVAGTLALLAVVLTVIGIYGLFSFTVAQRRREIGIRLALGDTPSGVARRVLGQGMWLAAIGVVLGLPLAFAGTQAAGARLAGVSAPTLPTLAAVAAVIMIAIGGACWLPARRASQVSPSEPLRAD